MSRPVTTALFDKSVEEYEVSHAADLDVWVAYDGGTVIVIQGAGGRDGDGDPNSGNSNAPDGLPRPSETEVRVRLISSTMGVR